MPGTTFNRGYPFPLPSDPADVPQSMQDLAEAIDADLAALTASVPLRPALRLTGSTPYTAVTDASINGYSALPLDTESFNTGIDYVIIQQQAPVGLQTIHAVNIRTPGLYFVQGTVVAPRRTPATAAGLGVRIMQGVGFPAAQTIRGRSTFGLQPSATDGSRGYTVSTVVRVVGGPSDNTNFLSIAFHSRQVTALVDSYTVGARSLAVVRMSPTP